MAGDLSRRAPLRGSDDEHDELAQNINAMLDQIESLLEGMRHVGDSVAHDLRGPITRLRNRLETVAAAEHPSRDDLADCVAQLDQVLATFNALLRIARVESGAYRSAFTTVDLKPIVRDVCELYQAAAEERQVDACAARRANRSRSTATASCSRRCSRTSSTTPSSTRRPAASFASSSRAAATARSSASPTRGPGIPAEDRSRVLQRFTRLDRARSQPGNGLGLALVNAVTLQHHGRLTLGDNAPGLVVTVELPALTPPRAAPPERRRRPERIAARVHSPSCERRLKNCARCARARAAQGASRLGHKTCIPPLRGRYFANADAAGVFRLVDGVDRRLRGRDDGLAGVRAARCARRFLHDTASHGAPYRIHHRRPRERLRRARGVTSSSQRPRTASCCSAPAAGSSTCRTSVSRATTRSRIKHAQGDLLSNVATVTISVVAAGGGNEPPVAAADSYTVNEGQTLNVGAPAACSPTTRTPTANPLTAVLVSGVANGTLALQPDGSFSFTPPPGFSGATSFTYQADDGTARSNTATATITVNAVNDAPTAQPDSYTTAEDTPLSVGGNGVLGNDTDPDGDTLTAELVRNVTNGTLQLNANGSFVYTPPANFNGTTSFTYRAHDAAAQSAAGHGHDHGHGRQRRAVHHESAADDGDRRRHVPLYAHGVGSRRHDADDQRADASELAHVHGARARSPARRPTPMSARTT